VAWQATIRERREIIRERSGHDMKRQTRITLEFSVNALIWIAWIVIMGSGTENGIGYFQQPRHDLWLPLIHGALWNAITFFGNAFWLMPRYLERQKFGAYFAGMGILSAGVLLLKTLGEKLIIIAAMPDLRDVPFPLLALENVWVLLAMIVLSLFYRFGRDWLTGARSGRQLESGDEAPPKEVWIKSGTRQERVPIEDILYVNACDNYVVFELPGRSLMALMTMKKALETLPAERFLRIHRSHIVPLDKVESVSTDAVVVAGTTLPIGRTFRKNVRKRLSNQI
jgi:hypothetical protein